MKNIMIVEDDDDIREVLASVLEEEGFGVTGFESLEAASQSLKLATERPNIILLDFMFPTGNSAGFLASIRDEFQNLPVILMSAGNDFIVGDNVTRANGFVSKPIQIDALLCEIEKLMPALAAGAKR